jgi:predicted SAM-dependent methyltransferase
MKATLKKLFIDLKSLPVIGKPVRFAIAFYRIPRTRAQLVGVLQTLPELSREQENLARSVRAALPKLRQDLSEEHQAVAANLRSSIEYLLERVEFVRRELMFELRYGAKTSHLGESTLEVQPKIISEKKVMAARAGRLRLNLGCGHVPLKGYINIDRRELPGVDVLAEVANMPFDAGEADELFSAHVLEHFPQEQLRRQLLPYWKSLLKPAGLFRAVVPDAETMISEYSAGSYPYDHLREVLYGRQDYDGDFHHNIFTPKHLSELLSEAGFEDVQLVEAGRRNGLCFEFEITARNPA